MSFDYKMRDYIQSIYSEINERIKTSRKILLTLVFLALLLDNLLLTAVVPVIPEYLLSLEKKSALTNITATFRSLLNATLENDTDVRNDTETFSQRTNSINISAGIKSVENLILLGENSKVGWLLASKAFVQLIVTPFVGPLINRIGCSIPMFCGILLLLVSTVFYAFGENYIILFIARSIHGLSTSCSTVAGLSLLASKYPDDKERSAAMGIALGGLALGVIIGYPYGSIAYDFLGKTTTFLLFGAIVLLESVLQVIVLKPSLENEYQVAGTSLTELLKDPYILLASGALLLPDMAMAMLESTIPIWLIGKLHPPKWQLGTVFLPDSIGFWIGCNLFGYAAIILGRWRCSSVGLLLIGISLACVPLVSHMLHLILPHFGIGLSLGMIDASLMPLLALLVDRRHVAQYGSVYAISQVAISLGFALGPVLGGLLVQYIGFNWLMRGMAIVNILYSPLCLLLRNPPTREESMAILGPSEHGKLHITTAKQADFRFHTLEEEDD